RLSRESDASPTRPRPSPLPITPTRTREVPTKVAPWRHGAGVLDADTSEDTLLATSPLPGAVGFRFAYEARARPQINQARDAASHLPLPAPPPPPQPRRRYQP